MEAVEVKANPPYQVQIGTGNLEEAGLLAASLFSPCRVMLVSDSNVLPLYGEKVKKAFEKAGFTVCVYCFAAGESSKNWVELGTLLEELAWQKFTRSDLIAALGGGVCGDLAGFAAAVYLRGISYLQLPTTLLAAVDSSVGGKTAVDLMAGKNLSGAFWQPAAVLCDCGVFETLPGEVFADGAAEMLKYGLLCSENLFASLEKGALRDRASLPGLVAECVKIKAGYVTKDERDAGERRFLNLGHTMGHAIELCSNFTVTHGRAVAIGMAAMARAAEKRGLAEKGLSKRVEAALAGLGLPVSTDCSAEQLAKAALHDKKRQGGTISLILPVAVGRCVLKAVPVETLAEWFSEGEARE